MFSPTTSALDLGEAFELGALVSTPLQPGVWAFLEPMGEQNHAPHLCWIRPDLLACVWMAGGQEGTAGMSIYLSLLAEGADRWSPPQRISQDPERSEQNPLLFVAEDELHLIHSAQRVRDPDDASWKEQADTTFSMQWTAALRQQTLPLGPLDPEQPESWGADAWSRCRDLLESPAFCRHPPVAMTTGLVLPIYRSLETGGSFGHDHSEVLPLTANGQAKGEARPVPESTGRVHGSIVPKVDGEGWLQFFRSRLADRIYRSSSPDGLAWTTPEPIALPNNNSSIHAQRLTSGRLALIFNRFGFEPDPTAAQEWGEANWPRTRWPLSVAISADDGDSWPWIRDLDTGFGFCGPFNWDLNGQLAYPVLLEGRPGELHIAYSWGGRQAIRYLCIDEHEIMGVLPD